MRVSRLLLAIVCVLLFIAVVGVSTLFVWALWPYQPLSIGGNLHILTEHPTSGGILDYTFEYCKLAEYADTDATVYHVLRSGDTSTYDFRLTSKFLPVGCHTGYMELMLPRLRPGRYVIEMHRIYRLNPVRRIDVSTHSDEFMVFDRVPAR